MVNVESHMTGVNEMFSRSDLRKCNNNNTIIRT